MSKNEADFTPTCFLVNDYFAILIALFSIECSPSTGPWCANCATRNEKSPDSMRVARNRQCSCWFQEPHECWRNCDPIVNKSGIFNTSLTARFRNPGTRVYIALTADNDS